MIVRKVLFPITLNGDLVKIKLLGNEKYGQRLKRLYYDGMKYLRNQYLT